MEQAMTGTGHNTTFHPSWEQEKTSITHSNFKVLPERSTAFFIDVTSKQTKNDIFYADGKEKCLLSLLEMSPIGAAHAEKYRVY